MFAISWAGALYIHLGELLPPNEILPCANALCIQVLHSPTLAALLQGIRAVGVSQSWRHGTWNGIMELLLLIIFNRWCHLYSQGGHHVGHRPTFNVDSLSIFYNTAAYLETIN